MPHLNNYGYRMIAITRDGKRRWVLEHRHVMEQHLGRALSPREHVHHINGDRLDNRLENLEVMSIAEHNRHHFTGVVPKGRPLVPHNKGKGKGRTLAECRCAVCGVVMQRPLGKITFNKKQGRKNVCSRRCRGRARQAKTIAVTRPHGGSLP